MKPMTSNPIGIVTFKINSLIRMSFDYILCLCKNQPISFFIVWMRQTIKLEKDSMYLARFVHCFDDDDVIQQMATGRKFYRLRNFLSDLGYVVKSVELLK